MDPRKSRSLSGDFHFNNFIRPEEVEKRSGGSRRATGIVRCKKVSPPQGGDELFFGAGGLRPPRPLGISSMPHSRSFLELFHHSGDLLPHCIFNVISQFIRAKTGRMKRKGCVRRLHENLTRNLSSVGKSGYIQHIY